MKQQSSFLPYGDVYLIETISRTRKTGLDFVPVSDRDYRSGLLPSENRCCFEVEGEVSVFKKILQGDMNTKKMQY